MIPPPSGIRSHNPGRRCGRRLKALKPDAGSSPNGSCPFSVRYLRACYWRITNSDRGNSESTVSGWWCAYAKDGYCLDVDGSSGRGQSSARLSFSGEASQLLLYVLHFAAKAVIESFLLRPIRANTIWWFTASM